MIHSARKYYVIISHQPLFMETSKRLLQANITEKSTSSPEDFPVSLFPRLEKEWDRTMTATSQLPHPMNNGWIKLHRQLQENPIWTSHPFTPGQAWVDLLMLANHDEKYILVRGIKIPITRGQVGWSEVRLATKWKWSRTRVRNFLNLLEKEQQIEQQKNNVSLVISIVNYKKYQLKEDSKPSSKVDSRSTAEVQQKDTNKKDKNVKNEKKSVVETPSVSTPAEIAKGFFTNIDTQDEWIQKIIAKGMPDADARREVKKFVRYWTEPNKSGTKQRWQMQETFELSRRLGTWLNNNFS